MLGGPLFHGRFVGRAQIGTNRFVTFFEFLAEHFGDEFRLLGETGVVDFFGLGLDRIDILEQNLRRIIREETGLPASIGAGSGKQYAKIASDAAKPDGVFIIPVEDQQEILAPMPVKVLWGVGPVTEAKLHQMGVENIADLAAMSAKEVEIVVDEAPFRLLRTAVGLTSADYVQVEGQFTRFNWLGGGRRLDISGTVGRLLTDQLDGVFPFRSVNTTPLPGAADNAFTRPTWQANVQLLQPAFPAVGSSAGVGFFTHRRVEPGVVVDRGYGGTLTLTRNVASRAPVSLQYQYELNRVLAGDIYFCVSYGICDRPTIGAMQGQHSLSPLILSGFVDRVDDALVRESGYSLRFALEHASDATLSDFRYDRADAELTRNIRMAGGTLAGRIQAGWVRAPEIEGPAAAGLRLHPTKRFYAGGARSTRGFGENQLGPRILTIPPTQLMESTEDGGAGCSLASIADQSCDPGAISSDEFTPRPVGGTRIVQAGVEFRRPIWREIVGAVFVDAARVDDPAIGALAAARSAITPGFGVRYRSPIGPVRVDLGIRPSDTEPLTVLTEMEDEDGTVRLVRLDAPKVFDPGEGQSGFLAALTRRVTLHLSIGESF